MSKNKIIDTFNDVDGYEPLAMVLAMAYDQAARGKGLVRHSMGRPFNDQRMMTIARQQGTHRGLEYQVHKKTSEGVDLPTKDARIKEFLGAINYLAGMVLFEMECGKDISEKRAPEKRTVKETMVNFYLAKNIPVPSFEHAWYAQDRTGTIWGYPCGKAVFDERRGVIKEPSLSTDGGQIKKIMKASLASDWDTRAVTRDELVKALIDARES